VADLQAVVEKVMAAQTQYREKVILLGESLRTAGGYPRAAEELIAFGRNPLLNPPP